MKMREIKQIYRKIYWAALCSGLCACFFVIFHPRKIVGFTTFIILIISAIFLLKFSLNAKRILPGKASTLSLLSGLFLIIGGALFDITITMIYSPDLSREANDIVRFFIDFGLPLSQLYLIGMLSQILYVSIISTFWIIFLKAYPLLLQQIPSTHFLKVALCTGQNSLYYQNLLRNIFYRLDQGGK